jgi:protein-S-isoprenylcysteine O-methyltransferase Ste14
MNALTLGVLWVVYYALHSAMASNGFKRYVKNRIAGLYPYYRLFYSFFALVNFVLLFFLHDMAPSEAVFHPLAGLVVAGYLLMLSGAGVALYAASHYGVDFLLKENSGSGLVDTGLNAYVRHPLYSGILLVLIGFFLSFPLWKNLVFVAVSILYLIVGSLLEEKKLIDEYGDEYLAYRQRVKMLIPWVL